MALIFGFSLLASTTLCVLMAARSGRSFSVRAGLLAAALGDGVFLFAVTEGLSRARWLVGPVVLACWIGFCLAKLALIWQFRSGVGAGFWRALLVSRLQTFRSLTGGERLMLASGALLAALAGAIALGAAPNNWDSMVHGLPRVLHWAQNGSVDFFPSRDVRYLCHPPYAGYVQLHLMLITGGDRFVHCSQWLALVGSAVAASLCAQSLGLSRRGQIAAALFALTVPPALLAAASPKEDLVMGFFLCSGLAFGLRSTGDWRTAGGVGVALGLALLTKATAYVYVPALGATLATVWLVRAGRAGWRRALLGTGGAMAMVTAVALLVAAPHFVRNLRHFGHPTGASELRRVAANEVVSPAIVAANGVRNLALHFQSDDLPPLIGDPFAELAQQTALKAVRMLRVDPDDPRTTWVGTKFSTASESVPRWHEDFLGFPLHLLLLGLGVAFAVRRRAVETVLLGVGLIGAFLLFATVLKWQPWHTRLHVPLALLGGPLAGIVAIEAQGRRWTGACVVALTLWGVVALLLNHAHPSIGGWTLWTAPRADQYFRSVDAKLVDSYRRAAEALAAERPARVGLLLLEDTFEYPLWKRLEALDDLPSIRHVEVGNSSVACGIRTEPSRFVFSNGLSDRRVRLEGKWYSCAFDSDPYRVYRLESTDFEHGEPTAVRFGKSVGLEAWTGPYPQWGMFEPVRWMVGRHASVEVISERGSATLVVLRLSARTPLTGQSLRLRYGDQILGECRFDEVDAWRTLETKPFLLTPGGNDLALEAGIVARPYADQVERAVLLQEIEVFSFTDSEGPDSHPMSGPNAGVSSLPGATAH